MTALGENRRRASQPPPDEAVWADIGAIFGPFGGSDGRFQRRAEAGSAFINSLGYYVSHRC